MTELGVVRAEGDRRSVRFERHYRATPEELWAALTEPEQLRGWLGEARIFEPRVGGRVGLQLGEGEEQAVGGTVLACEPQRLLEYEWRWPGEHESVLRLELRADGDGTLLVLDHRLLPATAATGYAAGWHAYLDLLALELEGTHGDWGERFAELLPAYRER